MIDPSAKLSVSRQAIVLGISRGSVYYKPRPASDSDLKLMHRINCPAGFCAANAEMEQTAHGVPVLGQPDVARSAGSGRVQGRAVARCHAPSRGIAAQCTAGQWMKRMGIKALYRRPNTSKPAPGHKIYPYLLRKLPITRPNRVSLTRM
jgi:putative transposase